MDRTRILHTGFGRLNEPLDLEPTQRPQFSSPNNEALDFSMTRSSLVAGNNKRDRFYLPPRNFIGRKVFRRPNMAPARSWKPQSGGIAGPYVFEGPVMKGYGIPFQTYQL